MHASETPLNPDLDASYMQRALALAEHGRYSTTPNPRVGAVIVRDGQVVGEGWHEVAGGDHAEVAALKAAGAQAKGATLYVTLEPCSHFGRTPPCCDAVIAAGISRVVAAMRDPNPNVAGRGFTELRAAGIALTEGVQELAARELNPGYIKRMETGLPRIRIKQAVSLDGRTAVASGESQWITGPEARGDVQRLRAESCAIVTGIGTLLADNPALTLRPQAHGLAAAEIRRQPLRIVLDSHFRTPLQAQVLCAPGDTLIVGTQDNEARRHLEAQGAPTLLLPKPLDLHELLSELGRRQLNEILIEAGPTLSGAWLRTGLVDELVLYMAPTLLGDAAKPLFHLPGIEHMTDRVLLEFLQWDRIGRDLRIRARIQV